jgi:hypothetical protein
VRLRRYYDGIMEEVALLLARGLIDDIVDGLRLL